MFGLCALLIAASAHAQSAKINVAVSILPLAEFVEQVGGDRVNVTLMIPPGANPHAYEPVPSQVAAFSQAQVFVIVGSGLSFERTWLEKLRQANPRLVLCDTSQGIELREAAAHHDHGGQEREHGHAGGADPHIWLSPVNAQSMVGTIARVLIQVDPDHAAAYQTRAERYRERLAAVHEEIKAASAAWTRRSFMVFHPAWGYFADTYGLHEIAVEQDGKEPTARQLAALIARARQEKIATVFVSPQFNRTSAEVIAREVDGHVVPVDDLARDYIANLERFTQALQAGQP
jgi:zinc transport system substrate-binding protein